MQSDPSPALAEVRVAELGADGDGRATLPGGAALYLAATLPGEDVRPGPLTARGKGFAAAAAILTPSPHRVAPRCRHFGPCGGCAVQHMDDDAYAAWKLGLVADAVRRLGFGGVLPPLARTPRARGGGWTWRSGARGLRCGSGCTSGARTRSSTWRSARCCIRASSASSRRCIRCCAACRGCGARRRRS